MNENIKKFLETFGKDEKLQKELALAKTVEEAYKIASGKVQGFTQDEFEVAMQQLKMAVLKNQGMEITDDDLEAVSGGMSGVEIIGITTSPVGATIGGVSAAATAAAI